MSRKIFEMHTINVQRQEDDDKNPQIPTVINKKHTLVAKECP